MTVPTSGGFPTPDVPGGYGFVRYLNHLETVPIPSTTANKDIVCCASVPQGQYWLPKLVRVSLQPANLQSSIGGVMSDTANILDIPFAQLYYGGPLQAGIFPAPNLNPNNNLYIDGTLQGNSDATGVVSGMLLAPGEALSVAWRNVTAPRDINGNSIGANATMEILGLYTNILPGTPGNPLGPIQQQLPESAGSHFAGKPLTATPAEPNQPPGIINFSAPGAGNKVNVVGSLPPAVKLLEMTWCWSGPEPTANQQSGVWQLANGSTVKMLLTEDTASTQWKRLTFGGGLSVDTYGAGNSTLQFLEDPASGMLVNTLACTGTLIYAAILPLP